jgi:perosamine synthetase
LIYVSEPTLLGNELLYVTDCVQSGWISSKGIYVEKFEEAFADYCRVKHAISTNNGTTGLHLALVALGVMPGDEVIVPNVTYIATANAVRYCGATPVLIDVEPNTLNIDSSLIEAAITTKTRGIIPVHLYGMPANLAEISKIAAKNNLWIIEDAAESLGSKFEEKMIGGISDATVFSFYGNKVITTGEGGMVTTNSDELASRLRLLRGQGMDLKKRFWFPVIGFNYRMTNIQAALGLAQLEQIEKFLRIRKEISEIYFRELTSLNESIVVPNSEMRSKSIFWLYNIHLKEVSGQMRDSVIEYLESQEIETRPVFYPLNDLPPYKSEIEFKVSKSWSYSGISLPLHCNLVERDIKKIVHLLGKSINNLLEYK